MTCIFCEIVKKNIPSQIVYETDQVLAFKDIAPVAPVHIVVIPKKHLKSVMEFDPEEGMLTVLLMRAIREIASAQQLPENGFRVVTNVGSHGGQSVHHVHFHILGGRPMTWPPG